jgi:hypothetical protein
MSSVWVLTREENQYDQYGEYFDAIFFKFPDKDQLIVYGVRPSSVEYVLAGGGRQGVENTWWNLKEYSDVD